jgi:RsiW-degrading membrane proteinase PrsW (M82 family)
MVALVEEAAKLLVVRTFVLARPRPGGAAGAIAGAACVGAGFAFGESLLYGLRGSEALVLRAFTAAPAHAMFTGIAGAFLASSTPGGGGRLAWLAGLAWAVVLHGLYDALVASGPAAWLVAPLLLGCLVALARLFAAARRKDAAARNLPSYQRPRAPIV